MGAMRFEGADPSFLVAEYNEFFAKDLHLFRQVAEFIRWANRLPIAAQQLALPAAFFNFRVRGCGPSIIIWARQRRRVPTQ